MTPFEAFVLGIIQGLTEYLPISSTAHLKVIPELLGWGDPGAAFTAVIQWGTVLACIVYFWSDIVRLTRGFLDGLLTRKPFGTMDSRLAWLIVFGTIPIVVAGLTLKKYIEGPFRSLYVIAGAAIFFAAVLLVAEILQRRRTAAGKELDQVGWFESIFVGVSQVFALIPGASRSGVTITGGLFAGLTRDTAARFSFLLGLPAITAAGALELYHARRELLGSHESIANLVIATVVSGIVGYLSIAFLLNYLRRHTTMVFIVYRVILGVALLVLLQQGLVKPGVETDPRPETEVQDHSQRQRGGHAPITSSISLNSR